MSTFNPYVPPSGPGAPPPLPSSIRPGPSLDFGRTLGFFFKDPNWVQKILVGSLFALLSMFLIGSVFIAGYAVRLIRRAARGEEHPLPEWDDLGGMFMDGLAVVGAYLAHVIPPAVGMLVVLIPMTMMTESGEEPSPALAVAMVPIVFLAVVALLAVVLYFPAAVTRMAVEERFSAAFEFGENWAFIKRNAVNYLLAIAAFIVSNFIAQFGILLFCIGILPATFWSQCVFAYAFGEVALRDPARAGSGVSPTLPPPVPQAIR